jgi:hypothetical protein
MIETRSFLRMQEYGLRGDKLRRNDAEGRYSKIFSPMIGSLLLKIKAAGD